MGSLSSLDIGYMISVGVLGMFAWNLGGGGTPAGWSAGFGYHTSSNTPSRMRMH